MDFGPFGLGEVVFIGFLALVLFGPRRLPELARSVGKLVTALRRGTEELKRSFQEELDAADASTRELRDAAGKFREAGRDLQSLGRSVIDEGRKLVVNAETAPVADPASAPIESSPERRAAVDEERRLVISGEPVPRPERVGTPSAIPRTPPGASRPGPESSSDDDEH